MLRSFFTLLLAASALAITAQTAPRRAHKATAHKTTAHKTAVHKVAAPVPAATSDATATDGSFGTRVPGAANGGGEGQGVYAAPGMAVDVTSGKEVEPYNSTNQKPGDKPAKRTTTLSPK